MKKIPYSGMRSSIGQYVRMASRINPVHMSTEVCARGLKTFCEQRRMTLTPLLMKVIADAALEYPLMRALLARDALGRKRIYIPEGVSIAVAVEKEYRGEVFVMTPVVFSVERKPLATISAELEDLARRPFQTMPDISARRLLNVLPAFLQYAVMRCISQSAPLAERFFGSIGISNIGKYGITQFAPVWVNTVVFGVGGIFDKPVVDNGQVVVAPVLHLSLSFNHSVIDGACAGRMLAAVRRRIEDQSYHHFT
ncbi:MAG: 2-oxo acid dehydrogenase subunit E2 [Desulfobacterota bacterium]|nr:2-oxo acid dehydrogenase subunit E2 [Thermodesulfobacteriota bacterium]